METDHQFGCQAVVNHADRQPDELRSSLYRLKCTGPIERQATNYKAVINNVEWHLSTSFLQVFIGYVMTRC
jgi:hypothetical protein